MLDNLEPSSDVSPRSVRRHHVERLKKNRQTYWGHGPQAHDGEMSDRHKGMVVHTPKACGCWRCRNPRRLDGTRTPQELRLSQRKLQDDTTPSE